MYVIGMNPAKMAELIKMPFGMWARVGPHNLVLDGGLDPPRGRDNFRGWHIWACPGMPTVGIFNKTMRLFIEFLRSFFLIVDADAVCLLLPDGVYNAAVNTRRGWY